MVFEEKKKVFFIILIILIIGFFSGCLNLSCANVDTSVVCNGWFENTALRNTGIQFLGLEKWCSLTYEISGKYPAFLTITTLKSLVLADEKEVLKKTKVTIQETFQDNIELTENSSGERLLKNNHKTLYTLFDGFDVYKKADVKIICEIWNCADSGNSVICIGIAYITNKDISDEFYFENWEKIVQDTTGTIDGYNGNMGLIYNVKCH